VSKKPVTGLDRLKEIRIPCLKTEKGESAQKPAEQAKKATVADRLKYSTRLEVDLRLLSQGVNERMRKENWG